MTIREARRAAGMTQKRLSETLGIPKRTIESWEAGDRTPPAYVERLIVDFVSHLPIDKKDPES